MKRRFNIESLLQNAKRLILKSCTIRYKYIAEVPEDLPRAKLSVFGTTWQYEDASDYKTVSYEYALRIAKDEFALNKNYFTTKIIQLSDKKISGLFIEVDNSEYIEIKEIYANVSDAVYPVGQAVSVAGEYIPSIEFIILSTDPEEDTYNSLEDIVATFNSSIDETTMIKANITFEEI